jgi:hypothetical protein
MSYSNYLEDKINEAVCNNVALQVAQSYVKLHVGDPGEDGTANAAGETTRKSCSFGTSSGGVATSDADMAWTNVSTAETYSYVSMWDTVGPAGGNCLGSGPLTTPRLVAVGDSFTIPSGSQTFTSA